MATIQRNAIGSWARLEPACEIFLFGHDEGTAEAARAFGACHVSEVAQNERGTPLLNDVFEKSARVAAHDLLCYINCDIVLGSEFVQAAAEVLRRRQRFLMVGECWNLDLAEPLAFDTPRWEEHLKALVRQSAKARGPRAIDYFVFSRGLYRDMPPFALGRARFDNWLIWHARQIGAPVVDATAVVTAVHQNHDYSHLPGGRYEVFHGAEAVRNEQLEGGVRHRYGIEEATHKLLPTGLTRSWAGYFKLKFFSRRVRRLNAEIFWQVVALTRVPRHALGLNSTNMKRLKARVTGQK